MKSAADYGQPAWLPKPVTHYELASILAYEADHGHERNHEPLDGGSYMPAIEYDTAERAMRHYGDEVLNYLATHGGVPVLSMRKYAWCQAPCFFLARAVLAFCRENAALADWENQNPIDLNHKES